MAEVLGLAANVIAVVDLFVKVGVLCSIYCTNLKTATHDIRSLLNEADRVSATLKDVERLLVGPDGAKIDVSQNIRCGIADCRAQLSDLVAKLEVGTRWKKIVWPLKKEEASEIIKKLERCRTTISLDLQVNQTCVRSFSLEAALTIPQGHCFSTFTRRLSWESYAPPKERPSMLAPRPITPGAIQAPESTSYSGY